MIGKFSYVKATTVPEAVERLQSPGAVLHAGGTDLLGCLRDAAVTADTVVSVSALDEMRGITRTKDGGLAIGALTTIDEIANNETVARRYAALAEAASEVGSPQLRNQGTLGGNLCQRPRCWYFRGEFHCLKKGGDTCYAVGGENQFHCIFGGGPCYIVFPSDTAPALAALEAQVGITGPRGVRTVPIEEFYQLPEQDIVHENVLAQGEVVTEVLLPPMSSRLLSRYRKVRARRAWDFALASAAIALSMERGRVEKARIVLGGVAPIPWRASAAEQAITGNLLNDETILAAAEAAVTDAEPLEKNAYKVELVKGILREELEKLS
jgi:xanthine dehydrogenase YagS FAD-binding subunit